MRASGDSAADVGSLPSEGTVVGGVWREEGRLGGALEFDGADDWLQVGGGLAVCVRGVVGGAVGQAYGRFCVVGAVRPEGPGLSGNAVSGDMAGHERGRVVDQASLVITVSGIARHWMIGCIWCSSVTAPRRGCIPTAYWWAPPKPPSTCRYGASAPGPGSNEYTAAWLDDIRIYDTALAAQQGQAAVRFLYARRGTNRRIGWFDRSMTPFAAPHVVSAGAVLLVRDEQGGGGRQLLDKTLETFRHCLGGVVRPKCVPSS